MRARSIYLARFPVLRLPVKVLGPLLSSFGVCRYFGFCLCFKRNSALGAGNALGNRGHTASLTNNFSYRTAEASTTTRLNYGLTPAARSASSSRVNWLG